MTTLDQTIIAAIIWRMALRTQGPRAAAAIARKYLATLNA